MADIFTTEQPASKPAIRWRLGLPVPLERLEVHVWAFRLEWFDWLKNLLSPAEIERASRFNFEDHRTRFLAGRGLLRLLLSNYTEGSPVDFAYGPNGKPFLTGPARAGGLEFNLSHADDLALVAVTRAGRVGIDIERVRPLPEADELAQRFFSSREASEFKRVPADKKAAAFLNLWTRKEAWLKATGEGIADSLHLIEVSFLPGEPARLLQIPAHLNLGRSWSLHEIVPAAGFVAALAVDVPEVRVCCWQASAEMWLNCAGPSRPQARRASKP